MTECWAVTCHRTDTRRYLVGPACPTHTPAALAGRPEPPTGDQYAWRHHAESYTQGRRSGSDINKERPGGYVSRQRAERIAEGTADRQKR